MVGVAVVGIIPVLVAVTLEGAADIAYGRADEERRLHATADRVAVGLDRELAGLAALLASLAAGLEAAPGGGPDGMQAAIAALAQRLDLPIALRAGMPERDSQVAGATGAGVTDVIARPGLGPDRLGIEGAMVFLPLTRDGAVVRVLEVVLTEARIADLIGRLVIRREVAVEVLDSRGRPVAHQGILPGDDAADGARRLVVVARPARAPGWLVVASEPYGLRRDPWTGLLIGHAVTAAAAVLLAAVAAWWLGGRLTRPLARLGERAQAVAAGLDAAVEVPASRVREFAVLRESQHRAEQALQEMHAAQAGLLGATRLSAMGALASGLAHEVNQPLAAATYFLAAAGRLLAGSGPAADAVRDASQQVQLAGEIMRRVRDFISRGEAAPEAVELGDLLFATRELARAGDMLGEAALTVRRPPAGLRVLADRVQMQQVLLNLIRNAAEAIASQKPPPGGRGRIILAASRAGAEAASAEAGGGAALAGAQITVSDNGPGLPPEVLARLFRPFTSTRRDGMGIGLAICHSIVEGHGGRLTVETGPRGTTFRVILPPARRKEEGDEPPVA